MPHPKKSKIAIVYDFDGTLAKGNIQDNSFIPDLGIEKSKFWEEVNQLTRENNMDQILAYMYKLIEEAKKTGCKYDKKSLAEHGKTVQYFGGVEDYFNRINCYASQHDTSIDHYIISSGTKEMIEGTSIAAKFKYIYASSFLYDQHGIPLWPALAINYTTKTQFLFRINKGIETIWDNKRINQYIPENERPMPFKNMIYIGDGLTDVPAMKMVKSQGGNSIGVYAPKSHQKQEVKKLLEQDRINYYAPADYSKGSQLNDIIQKLITQISAREYLLKNYTS